MLIGMVSTIALILAIGPQLQVLPSETDETAPAEVERIIEDAADEVLIEPETPVLPALDEPEASEATASDQTDAPEVETEPEPTEPVQSEPETEASNPGATAEMEDDTPTIEEEVVTTEEAGPETTPARTGNVPEAEWPTLLSAASEALAAAKTAKGNFIQSNADGSVATGTFALNRPGRMRFDYDDPTPVLIVSDGATVAMQDSELETIDRIPIGSTPLGLILSTRLDVDRDIDVLSIQQNDERIGIRVEDASGELEGTLTMVFARDTYDLLGWLAVDGNLQTTVVDLVDVETNVRIDPRLFRLDEDDDEEDER